VHENRRTVSSIESSDVSLDAYVRSLQIELARSLEHKKAIYLDIKFWIILRDVAAGMRKDPAELELLSLLREGVVKDKLFCPISDSTFAELLKKADVLSREATANLIDELSLGVTHIPHELRANTELAHFLHSARTPHEVHPLDHLVWSKLSYVMGFLHPRGTEFDEATELVMQKMFVDHMWTLSMREMIDRIGDHKLPNPERFEVLAQRLNELNTRYATELGTFAQTYDNELHGILDAFNDVAVDIVEQMARIEYGDKPPLSPDQRQEEGRFLHKLLFAAFKKEATKDALPSLHILASLHAAIRWNKQQKLKANDFLDFQHASAALGYCDAFFTERSLRSMVTAGHIALDRRYACHVVSSPEDAVTYLRGLLAGWRVAHP
jgi:hypothetical protein